VKEFQVIQEWTPALGARTLDDAGFVALLDRIQSELGTGAHVSGNLLRVVVRVSVTAETPEAAEVEGLARIRDVLDPLPLRPGDRPSSVDLRVTPE
jgi:hypothetical protein